VVFKFRILDWHVSCIRKWRAGKRKGGLRLKPQKAVLIDHNQLWGPEFEGRFKLSKWGLVAKDPGRLSKTGDAAGPSFFCS
jgi:hypothetical protein